MRDEALAKIHKARLRRLEILEEQLATLGETNADPAQIAERDQLRETLGIVEAADPTIDPEARAALRKRDQVDLNINVLSNVVQRLSTMEERWWLDMGNRSRRQRIMDLWMLGITALLVWSVFFR